MLDFIKFGKGIMEHLNRKMGGNVGVQYKITRNELEDLALQNETILDFYTKFKLDKQKRAEIEVITKAKSNYVIAGIKLKNSNSVLLDGAYSQSEESGGELIKYHFSSKKKLYNGYSGLKSHEDKITPIEQKPVNDEEVIKLYKEGLSVYEIARMFKRSSSNIQARIPVEIQRQSAENIQKRTEEIIKLYKEGHSEREIGRLLNMSQPNVHHRIPKELRAEKTKQLNARNEQIVEMYKQGLSIKDIAASVKMSYETVSHTVLKYKKSENIAANKNNYKGEVIRLSALGKSAAEISSELNVSLRTVYSYFPKELLKSNIEKNQKVDEATVAEIIKLRKEGLKTGEIAKRLNLGATTVNSYIPEEFKQKQTLITKEIQDGILELRKSGYSTLEIAKMLNLSKSTVIKYVPEEYKKTPELSKNTKLSVLKLVKEGVSPNVISQRLNLSEYEVNTVIHQSEISQNKRRATITPAIIEQIHKMRQSGCTTSQIAEELHISTTAVNAHTPKLFKSKKLVKITDDLKQEILQKRLSGKSASEIAEELGIAIGTVNNYLPKELKTGKRKFKVGQKELGLIDAETIISMRKSGFKISQISKELGISDATVYRLLPQELKPGRTIDKDAEQRIIKMRLAGMSAPAIAKEMNVSTSTVARYFPKELKNFYEDISGITREQYKHALIEGVTNDKICEILNIGYSGLERLNKRFSAVSKKEIKDSTKETWFRKYEQFNNEELKEHFLTVVNSLFDNGQVNEKTELGHSLNKITDEILQNNMSFKTRNSFISLLRTLDLTERNVVTDTILAKSDEFKSIKDWADKAAFVDNLKEIKDYYANDYLPQNGQFELAKVFNGMEIKGIDDPNAEIIKSYIDAISNSKDIRKESFKILRLNSYRTAAPQTRKAAEKYSLTHIGEIDEQLAGQYIRNLTALKNTSKIETPYPKEYIDIIKGENLPERLSVHYLMKLDNWFSNQNRDKELLDDFLKEFDISGRVDSAIIKEYVMNTYAKQDTYIMASGHNIKSQEVIFDKKAKEGIEEYYGYPNCVQWLKDFENAMHTFVPPKGQTGIKYMNNLREYEVKLVDKGDRIVSSDKSFRFDVFRKKHGK